MNCSKILDMVYEHENLSLAARIQVGLHLMFCPDCAREAGRFEVCHDILRNDFLPPSPGLEDAVMALLSGEEHALELHETSVQGAGAFPGGFSTRGWIIAGIVMLVSLATAFFGLEFNKIAIAAGISFMIPVGITIGIILTCYGALFIGSHMKELTERFGL
ncbi:MAG: peptidoglycan-binding protein [Treponema sp.]|nr:peptidoglycan-binding protein [Treponema sp.]